MATIALKGMQWVTDCGHCDGTGFVMYHFTRATCTNCHGVGQRKRFALGWREKFASELAKTIAEPFKHSRFQMMSEMRLAAHVSRKSILDITNISGC